MNDIPLNILTLPIWWYTTGLSVFLGWMSKKYSYYLHTSGLLHLARHWNEPLFGDYTKGGVFISFFIRIFLILYKSLQLGIRSLYLVTSLLLYLVILPVTLIIIFYQAFGLYKPHV